MTTARSDSGRGGKPERFCANHENVSRELNQTREQPPLFLAQRHKDEDEKRANALIP
jgi:hypothetical protein